MNHYPKKTITAAVLVLCLLAGLASPLPTNAASTSPKLFGHRGYSGRYMENTMSAFEGAKEAGFYGIELDIWESTNGNLMVFHDEDLKDLTRKEGKIWDVNTSNRSNYMVVKGSERYKIPTLKEALKYASKNNLRVFIHVKCPSTGEHSMSAKGAKKVAKLIKQYKMTKKAVVFAASEKTMNKFVNKGIRIGRSSGKTDRAKVNKIVKWLQQNHGDTMIILKVPTVKQSTFGKSFVDYCHKRGIQTGTYWTKTCSQYSYMRSVGADFCMSNYKLI